jgi:three-Cys-motif partner protein
MPQNLIPLAYMGREQALIKHNILEKYLEKLTAILSVNQPVLEFTYIDCFAGPWQADESQMGSTSIAISLQILDRCKTAVENRGGRAVIRALYLEQSNEAYPFLKRYLDKQTPIGIEAHSIQGEFVASRQKILDWVGLKGSAFFFIDPKGWTEVKVNTLAPLLARPRSEFVINFMYEFVRRTFGMERFASEMYDLIGEAIGSGLQDEDPESSILNAYRKNLKARVPITRSNYPVRSVYAKVKHPHQERTKYHLVYLTTHPKGLIKFMETYEEAADLQGAVRAQIRDGKKAAKTGTADLFSDEPSYVDDSGIKNNFSIIDDFWMNYIGIECAIDEAKFAQILEDNSWFPGELQASLVRLIAQKKIENLDASKPRLKKPLHYWERGGERLRVLPF